MYAQSVYSDRAVLVAVTIQAMYRYLAVTVQSPYSNCNACAYVCKRLCTHVYTQAILPHLHVAGLAEFFDDVDVFGQESPELKAVNRVKAKLISAIMHDHEWSCADVLFIDDSPKHISLAKGTCDTFEVSGRGLCVDEIDFIERTVLDSDYDATVPPFTLDRSTAVERSTASDGMCDWAITQSGGFVRRIGKMSRNEAHEIVARENSGRKRGEVAVALFVMLPVALTVALTVPLTVAEVRCLAFQQHSS